MEAPTPGAGDWGKGLAPQGRDGVGAGVRRCWATCLCDPSLARAARCHRHLPRESGLRARKRRPVVATLRCRLGPSETSESFGSLNINGRLVRAVPGARGVRPRKGDSNEARWRLQRLSRIV